MKNKDLIIPLVGAAGLALAGMTGSSSYVQTLVITFCVYSIAILGLDLVTGRVGEVSVGHAGLMGTGSYAAAYGSVTLGIHPALAMAVAVLAGAVIGFGLALPALKSKGPTMALMTLAFGSLASLIFSQSQWTGGEVGLQVAALGNVYWIAIGALVASILAAHMIVMSKTGRAFSAIESSEIAVDVLGVGVARHKIIAFTLSGAFCGLAGAVFAFSQNIVIPGQFSFEVSLTILLGLLVGGKKSLTGALLGGGVAVALPLFLSSFGEFQGLVYAAIILACINFLPNGIAGFFNLQVPHTPVATGQSSAIHPISSSSEFVLEAHDVGMSFAGFNALKNVSLKVKAGTCCALIGPNGAGKSTFMNVVTGIYRPTSGTIVRHGILSRTFQNLEIFTGGLTVLDNVLVGLHYHPSADRVNRAYALLTLVGLESFAATPANDLSYAQKRFVEIARALGTNPAFLMLDEPAAGMRGDDLTRLADLIQVIKRNGISVLLIDHHLDICFGATTEPNDQVLVLDAGAPLAIGKPEEIRHNQAVLTAYLGETVC